MSTDYRECVNSDGTVDLECISDVNQQMTTYITELTERVSKIKEEIDELNQRLISVVESVSKDESDFVACLEFANDYVLGESHFVEEDGYSIIDPNTPILTSLPVGMDEEYDYEYFDEPLATYGMWEGDSDFDPEENVDSVYDYI